jgi:pilus assembly protein CpaC
VNGQRSQNNVCAGMRRMTRPILAGLAAIVAAGAAAAQDAQLAERRLNEETLTVEVGRSVLVAPPWPVSRVSIIKPDVADVQVLTPRQVLVIGNQVGSTDLLLWSDDETVWRRRIDVVVDLSFLQDEVNRMFPPPGAELELIQSREAIVVRGRLRRAEDAERLRSFLAMHGVQYVDMSSLSGVQQVLLQVKVAEVSRSALRALGVNFFHASDNFFGGNVLGSSGGPLNPVSIGVPEGARAGAGLPFEFLRDTGVSPAVTFFAGLPRADFEVFVQALAENQYLRILAEPNLVALSGEEASFLAGGEFPIPVVQSGIGAAATISIQYREFGVRLAFRPVVLGDNTIRLHVAPEVSDLTDIGAVEIQGFRIPGILTRRAETTLELKSGQTFAMAGLLNTRTDARVSRIPVLGELPVLGPLFRSVRYSRGETELAVLVTASLVEPLSLADAPPVPGMLDIEPNDWELFAEGLIQGRSPARISEADAEYLRELGLHRLRGPGAWASPPPVEVARH